ncbi:ABC transporter ATP-binding protein [Streptomyces sp. A244]|uniref:ATP-binding cassette domain-containing protein n=1 Tax=Streptomyces sp. A244 TaxID=2137016 RepID=UPI000D1B838A|nr:ATP-binding cassette domain-containing protein [Streptomyces sp. A244]PTH90238.1 ABC transporter ATP-binding protein [Streptomyces sp. A244]
MTSFDTNAVIRTEGLRKAYGETEAVAGLDLAVPAGEIFGFLGPNGAGKSTTINMLCTLLRPTSGRADVAGHDIVREADEVRRSIGLVFQETTLDKELTVEENLRFQADLFDVPRRRAQDRIGHLLELMDLADRRGAPVRTLSGGMQRRLEIARGLLHSPRVLFLDEPTTGLDPQTRVVIWEYLRQLPREHGVTIFLTTHHLAEAEYCGRLAIMDGGKLLVEDTPALLKAVIASDLVEIRTGDDQAAAEAIRTRFGVETTRSAEGLRFRVADGAAFVPRLCSELTVPIHSVTVTPPTLDDVFLHYTGRTIRDTGASGSTLMAGPRR